MTTLKRVLALLCAAALIISLTACGAKAEPSEPDTPNDSSASEPASGSDDEPADEPEAEPADVPEAEPAEEPEEPGADEPAYEPAPEPTPEPAPEPEPTPGNSGFTFDPYLVSEECRECYGEEFVQFYRDFITAYMNYETSCPCPNETCAMNLPLVLDYECPFFTGGDINYSWAADYDYFGQSISWSYNIDEAALKERISSVSAVMQGFLDLVSPEDDEADRVQTLYHAFCPLMTYDHDAAVSREEIDSCYVLLEHRGICYGFSCVFSQLMSQAGLYETIASGEMTSGEGHIWNCVRVNGSFYYFDTTFELNYKGGTAYVYYGMTAEERAADISAEGLWCGRYCDTMPTIAGTHLNVR